MKKLNRILIIAFVVIIIILPLMFFVNSTNAGYVKSGTYTSPPVGGENVQTIYDMEALGRNEPKGTDMKFTFAFSNSHDGPFKEANPSQYYINYDQLQISHFQIIENARKSVGLENAKYIKIKAELSTTNESITPSFSGFRVRYTPIDNIAPSAPKNVKFEIEQPWDDQHAAKISWDQSIDDRSSNVTYEIYSSNTATKFPLTISTELNWYYRFSGLDCGKEYQYQVVAIDESKNRSQPSETASLKTPVCPNTPFIKFFTANPLSMPARESSILSWSVNNAEKVSINNGIGEVEKEGKAEVKPTEHTTYTLTAENEKGTSTVSTTIYVEKIAHEPGPVWINNFTSSSSKIKKGQSATLSWKVFDANSISIDNDIGKVEAKSSVEVSPPVTTTYTLTATGIGTETKSVTITVEETEQKLPIINIFDINPNSITKGELATISWDVSDADLVSIDQDIGNVNTKGTKSISPSQDTTYTLTAKNDSEESKATVSILVTEQIQEKAPIIISFTADSQTIDKGSEVILSWEVSDAKNILIENIIDNLDSIGTQKVSPDKDTNYTLKVSNDTDERSATIEILVQDKPAVVIDPPEEISIVHEEKEIILDWKETAEATGYNLYDENNQLIVSTEESKTTLGQTKDGESYKFSISSHDNDGNESEKTKVEFTTPFTPEQITMLDEKKIKGGLAGITSLVSTGSSLWFNIIIALIIAAILFYLIVLRKKKQIAIQSLVPVQTMSSQTKIFSIKNRTIVIIIITMILIFIGILIWANQTGKINIFGEIQKQDLIKTDYNFLSGGSFNPDQIAVEPAAGKGKVRLKENYPRTYISYNNHLNHNSKYILNLDVRNNSSMKYMDIYMPVPTTWVNQQQYVNIDSMGSPNGSVEIYDEIKHGIKFAKFHQADFIGPKNFSMWENFRYSSNAIDTVFNEDENIVYNTGSDLYKKYTANEPYLEKDYFLDKIPGSVTSQPTVIKKIKALYEYVVGHMTYTVTSHTLDEFGAKYAYNTGRGECGDYSALFVAMARAIGVPARPVVGFITSNGGNHVWAEFYIPGNGWSPVDVTWADTSPINYQYFGDLDNQRLIMSKNYNIDLGDGHITPALQWGAYWYWYNNFQPDIKINYSYSE